MTSEISRAPHFCTLASKLSCIHELCLMECLMLKSQMEESVVVRKKTTGLQALLTSLKSKSWPVEKIYITQCMTFMLKLGRVMQEQGVGSDRFCKYYLFLKRSNEAGNSPK